MIRWRDHRALRLDSLFSSWVFGCTKCTDSSAKWVWWQFQSIDACSNQMIQCTAPIDSFRLRQRKEWSYSRNRTVMDWSAWWTAPDIIRPEIFPRPTDRTARRECFFAWAYHQLRKHIFARLILDEICTLLNN